MFSQEMPKDVCAGFGYYPVLESVQFVFMALTLRKA